MTNPVADALELLREIKYLLQELVRVVRYSRGGYDGPILALRVVTLTSPVGTVPVAVAAHDGREDATALLFTWDGTGVAGDHAFVAPSQSTRNGIRLDLSGPGVARIIADRRQALFLHPRLEGKTVTTTKVSVVEGAL